MERTEYNYYKELIGMKAIVELRHFTVAEFANRFDVIERRMGVDVRTEMRYIGGGKTEGGWEFTQIRDRMYRYLRVLVKKNLLVEVSGMGRIWWYFTPEKKLAILKQIAKIEKNAPAKN